MYFRLSDSCLGFQALSCLLLAPLLWLAPHLDLLWTHIWHRNTNLLAVTL